MATTYCERCGHGNCERPCEKCGSYDVSWDEYSDHSPALFDDYTDTDSEDNDE